MQQQLWLFAAALSLGVVLAAAIDFYRRLLLCHRPRRQRRHYLLPDAVFSLAAILGLLLYWFLLTDGSLRFAAFIWIGVGIVLYMRLLSPRLP